MLFSGVGETSVGRSKAVCAKWARDGERWTVRNISECEILKEMQQNSRSS